MAGIESAGYYQAAWALSGLFAGFVLGAMGADFYPRLSGLIHDREAAIRAVNEQTEIGVLLALPGLLATLALAPWVIHAFYTKEFVPRFILIFGMCEYSPRVPGCGASSIVGLARQSYIFSRAKHFYLLIARR